MLTLAAEVLIRTTHSACVQALVLRMGSSSAAEGCSRHGGTSAEPVCEAPYNLHRNTRGHALPAARRGFP